VPLLLGEPTSPLRPRRRRRRFRQRHQLGAAAPGQYSFINPDLTVYLHRYPVGEWVCLDAVTHPQSNGIGLAESALFDEEGSIGRAAQSLLIERAREEQK
jgi:acyl-CoA thioesterase